MPIDRPKGNLIAGVFGASSQVIFNTLCFFLVYKIGIDELGIEIMGTWGLAVSVISLIKLFDFGISGALIKTTASLLSRGEKGYAFAVIRASLASVIVYSSLAGFFFYFISDYALVNMFDSRLVKLIEPFIGIMVVQSILACISISSLACLDGINRIDLRAMISMLAAIATMICAYVAIPRLGLQGLIYAQVLQMIILILGSMVVLGRVVGFNIIGKLKFTENLNLYSYGMKFQLGNICFLLSEAFVKLMIAKFGSVSEIPYYDMARKFTDQLRFMFAAAGGPIVPMVASINSAKEGTAGIIYTRATELLMYFAFPAYTALILFSPGLELILFGTSNGTLVSFVIILSISSIISVASIPPFVIALGEGTLKWNVISYVMYLLTILCLAWPLTLYYGSLGSVISISLAIVFSNLFILIPFALAKNVNLIAILTNKNHKLILSCSLIIFLSCISIIMGFVKLIPLSNASYFLAVSVFFLPIYFMWKSPLRSDLLSFLRDR